MDSVDWVLTLNSSETLDLLKVSNFTSDSDFCFPLYLRVWVSLVSGVIFLVGVVGNALVPILVWKSKQLRHSTNIFLLNLAVADVLVLLVCLPTALVELHTVPNTWVLGSFLCRLVPFVEVSVLRASVLTLTVISVERYIAICKPLRSTSMCTRARAFAISLAIWPISALAAGPMIVATQQHEILLSNGNKEFECITSLQDLWTYCYFLGSACGFFLVPLLFLATLYFLITRRLLIQRYSSVNKADNSQWRARKQVASMLGAVVVIFFVCLLPFQLFTLWLIIVPTEIINSMGPDVYFNILFVCRVLIYCNSAVNPIIYNAMSAKFREALLRLMVDCPGGDPGRRLLSRRSTFTTTVSSSTSSSTSFRRRASLAIRRSFSDVSCKRTSFIVIKGPHSSPADPPKKRRHLFWNIKQSVPGFKNSECISIMPETDAGFLPKVETLDDAGPASDSTCSLPLPEVASNLLAKPSLNAQHWIVSENHHNFTSFPKRVSFDDPFDVNSELDRKPNRS